VSTQIDFTLSPAFEKLGPEQRDKLEEIAFSQKFPPGKYVFHQGEESWGVYLVAKGLAGVEVDVGGQVVGLHEVGPGALLGWSGLTPPHTFTCSAIAIQETELIGFRLDELQAAMDADETLAGAFLGAINGIVIDRLRETQNRLAEFVSWYRYCRGYPLSYSQEEATIGRGKRPKAPEWTRALEDLEPARR